MFDIFNYTRKNHRFVRDFHTSRRPRLNIGSAPLYSIADVDNCSLRLFCVLVGITTVVGVVDDVLSDACAV